MNGYLEYKENASDYNIENDTIDYKTGLTFQEFKKNNNINKFRPAVFLLVTGNMDEVDNISEIKQRIIQNVFNNVKNMDGEYIKFILGSKVMSEAVTLKNCKEIHIIDSFYNIPRINQVIGRVIRMCVHMDVVNDTNYRYPSVNIYKYVITIDTRQKGKLSIDEKLYQKGHFFRKKK